MFVSEISLTVESPNPNDLPRLGEVLQISLPRMNEPQEFTVSATQIKRRWVQDGGDDEGYVYGGSIDLEAVYEDDEDEDGDDEDAPVPVEAKRGAVR